MSWCWGADTAAVINEKMYADERLLCNTLYIQQHHLVLDDWTGYLIITKYLAVGWSPFDSCHLIMTLNWNTTRVLTWVYSFKQPSSRNWFLNTEFRKIYRVELVLGINLTSRMESIWRRLRSMSLEPHQSRRLLLLIASRLCTESVCVDFDCANIIIIIMRQLPKWMCSYIRSVIQH